MATLNARIRQGSGKGFARKLRKAGEVPATAYGHGQEPESLSVNAHELEVLLARINPETTLIELSVEGGRTSSALIREVQHHPSRPTILHVDLFKVKAGEKLHVAVPIRLHGTPVGVRDAGGVLQEVLYELTVECLPKDIPAAIDVDVEKLELGRSVHVSDVSVPNATILNDGDLVICTVTVPATQQVEEEAAEGDEAEPALVRERTEEE
jgi:large subunit ribosomal protein L25